jgi:nitrite reductase/ring-hydroxylating ferredoxin subunit
MSVDVGPVGDFPMKHMRIIDVGARQIGVVRWGDRIFAVNNLCAHQGGPVCRGVLSGRLAASRPGELTLDDSAPTLACPWHGWEFDLLTRRAFWIRNSGCALSLLALSMDACWST